MKYFPLDVLCCVSHTLEQMLALRAHFVLWVPSLAFLLLFFWTINRPVPKIKFYNIAILLYKIDVGIWDSDLSGRSFSRLENAPIWWKTIRNMYVCLFGRSMSKAFGIPMWAITNKACVGLPGIACPISPPNCPIPRSVCTIIASSGNWLFTQHTRTPWMYLLTRLLTYIHIVVVALRLVHLYFVFVFCFSMLCAKSDNWFGNAVLAGQFWFYLIFTFNVFVHYFSIWRRINAIPKLQENVF